MFLPPNLKPRQVHVRQLVKNWQRLRTGLSKPGALVPGLVGDPPQQAHLRLIPGGQEGNEALELLVAQPRREVAVPPSLACATRPCPLLAPEAQGLAIFQRARGLCWCDEAWRQLWGSAWRDAVRWQENSLAVYGTHPDPQGEGDLLRTIRDGGQLALHGIVSQQGSGTALDLFLSAPVDAMGYTTHLVVWATPAVPPQVAPPATATTAVPRAPELLARLLGVSDFLRLHADTQSCLEDIVRAAQQALGFRIVVLNLLDPETKLFASHAFVGLDEEGQRIIGNSAYSLEAVHRLMREEFRHGECYFLPAGSFDWGHDFSGPTYEALARDPTWHKLEEEDAWDSLDALFVPVRLEEHEVVGLLWLDGPINGRRPTEDVFRALELFSRQVAVAIGNARQFMEMRRLTLVDELTGLYNRRGLYQLGSHEVERARRLHRPLAALFLDVDHFREFNNRYSHAVGDRVLREVASCARATVRNIDIVARYGGEEFVVLLLETDLDRALEVGERLRKAVEAVQVATPQGPSRVTVSVGVATLSEDTETLDDLLSQANAAEHLAKTRGRNRTVFLPPSSRFFQK